jgi:hypothetical protein
MPDEIRLRIVVENPPAGVTFQLQKGKSLLTKPTTSSRGKLFFDFTVRIGRDRDARFPKLLGDYTQGKPSERFVYVNSGTFAGQANSCWSRRAKVPLSGITWSLIESASAPGATLQARIAGKAGDGGPACATVPLLDGGWTVETKSNARA